MGFTKFLAVATALLTFGTAAPGAAKTLAVEVSFIGFVQRIIGSSGEPYIMNGDRVTGDFAFDINDDSVISKVSGAFAVQGVVGRIIGSEPFVQRSEFPEIEFATAVLSTTQIGESDANGAFNLSRFEIEIASDLFETDAPFFPAFELFAAGDAFLKSVNARGQRSFANSDGSSTTFSNNFLMFESSSVTVSPVPLPAALPLLLAGLGAVAVVRTRRRAVRGAPGVPVRP